jgi:hypothetical protein
MRSYLYLVLMLLFGLPRLAAEPADKPMTIYVVRTGEQLQGPHVLTYRLFEFIQQRGRWILPDLGYYDVGRFDVQLWYAGAGAELRHFRHAVWTEEVYLVQQEGSTAHNQHALFLWSQIDAKLKPRLTVQAIAYPTVPLNRAQRWGFDIDRAKMEYAVRPHLLAGVGYSASVGADCTWQNRPFVTSTVINRAGSWEFWLERMPGGAQVQMRYQIVHSGAY